MPQVKSCRISCVRITSGLYPGRCYSGVIRPNNNSEQLIVGTAAESIADAMKQVIANGGGR